MLIGIDGNEANVKNRVGVGQYAFELLRKFHVLVNNTSDGGPERSRRDSSEVNQLQFSIYLKERPLSDLPKERDGWRYKVVRPKRFWTQVSLPLHLFLDKLRPDVFFTPTHYAPRFSPVPTVISIMDLSYLHFPQMFKKQDLYQLKNWTAYSVRQAKKIITISESSKKDIVKFYGRKVEDIVVTYPGYDEAFNPRIKKQELRIKEIKEKYGIKGDYILYVGTLQPRKNLVSLIEAFSQLTPEVGGTPPKARGDTSGVENLSLVIAGKKGWLYDEILGKAKELGIEDRVIFTDYVPDGDLPYLMAGAKLYILPSLYEGFGIPVIEAMACGVPVVCSNVSSLPEVGGEAAVYVNPESVESISEGIKEVLGWSQKKRDDMIKKGLKQALNFSWQKCAEEILKVLREVTK